MQTFPANKINIDQTNIPVPILNTFEEATKCYEQQCYVASAIMIRKTLEVLCHDRGATGADLRQRISNLRNTVVIPAELLDGIDELHLFGSDAAHIESGVYDSIGNEEVDLAFELLKEIIKAVFQYSTLVNKLKTVRKSPGVEE